MKKIILMTLLLLFNAGISFAIEEKVPIKIAPIEPISTTFDQTEVGDKFPFRVIEDVFVNDKIFIKKGTTMYGTVDFIKENGWFGDNAEIEFRVFRVRNASGKLTTFASELSLTGLNTLKWYNPKWKRFFNYCSIIFRGKEIDINPSTSNPEFNIWYQAR